MKKHTMLKPIKPNRNYNPTNFLFYRFSKSPFKYGAVPSANSASLTSICENGMGITRIPISLPLKKEIIALAKNRNKKGAKGQPCRTDREIVNKGP